MSNPSNIYAEKIYSEQPTAMWSLDDTADYISFVDSELKRSVHLWTIENGLGSAGTSENEPFQSSVVSSLNGQTDKTYIKAVSPDFAKFTDFDQDLRVFSIGAYVYSPSTYLSGVEIGYEYYDSTSGTTESVSKVFNVNIGKKWLNVSDTFIIPRQDVYFRPFIKVSYIPGGVANDYKFLVNGLTVGQWNEEFSAKSLGVNKIQVPSTVRLLAGHDAIEAPSYGLQNSPGYYLVNNNRLLAQNSGIPLVFGSSNVTHLITNDNTLPSFIFPGCGFLNESGKYEEKTLEFWIRIFANTSTPKRLVGPVASTDGLYSYKNNLILRVGNYTQAYAIDEWYRPMLIDLRVGVNNASLLINGDEVISISIDIDTITFPDKTSKIGSTYFDNDWIGFYSYSEITQFDIDAIAIYPYKVPALVAKRRFVYGQGVEYPEILNSSYGGTSTVIDYPFSKYTNNYSYPDQGSWASGYFTNLSVTNNTLSTPNYRLPDFVFSNKSYDDFYLANSTIQNDNDGNFLTIRPSVDWASTNGYIHFDKLNILTDRTEAVYGVFKIAEHKTQAQVLIRIEDSSSGNYFSLELVGESLKYKFKNGGNISVAYSAEGVLVGSPFIAGISIDKFRDAFGSDAATLFGNRASLSVYVGGTKEFTNTFSGKIFGIHFANKDTLDLVSYGFSDKGVPLDYENVFADYTSGPYVGETDYDAEFYNTAFWANLVDGGNVSSYVSSRIGSVVSSYSLLPQYFMGLFKIDIGCHGYWKTTLPLTYFGKYVNDSYGDSYYDLDFLQFNISVPSPSKFVTVESLGSWKYEDLKQAYSSEEFNSYAYLNNQLYTNYNDYLDLKNRSEKTYSYDTSENPIRTRVTFEYTESAGQTPDSAYNLQVAPNKNGTVIAGSNWINTAYEVVDGMIIYPPSDVNFEDMSISISVDMITRSMLSLPMSIKQLQLSSQSFSEDGFNPIGTKFGVDIYPYAKSGLYYDYKTANPYSIYKKSTPYLYLTRDSGISIKGDFKSGVDRGIAIPINASKSSTYNLMAAQFSLRYDYEFFPFSPVKILSFDNGTRFIDIFLVANTSDGKRAKLYAVNAATGIVESGIAFYVNGTLSREPVIQAGHWDMLGIYFSDLLNLNSINGKFLVSGPVTINNISLYDASRLSEVRDLQTRPWFRVKVTNDPEDLYEWTFWDLDFNWDEVLVVATTSLYGVNPETLYKTFIGTNRFVIDDSLPLIVGKYQYSVNSDVRWQQGVQTST